MRKTIIRGTKYDYYHYNKEAKLKSSVLASRRQRNGFILNQNNDSTMDDNSIGPYEKSK